MYCYCQQYNQGRVNDNSELLIWNGHCCHVPTQFISGVDQVSQTYDKVEMLKVVFHYQLKMGCTRRGIHIDKSGRRAWVVNISTAGDLQMGSEIIEMTLDRIFNDHKLELETKANKGVVRSPGPKMKTTIVDKDILYIIILFVNITCMYIGGVVNLKLFKHVSIGVHVPIYICI